MMDAILELPIYTYSRSRTVFYALEYAFLNVLSATLPGTARFRSKLDLHTLKLIQHELNEIIKRDSRNIRQGLYPISVLKPESPLAHMRRFPKLLADGLGLYWRRLNGRTTQFSQNAKDYLDELPRYYRRNFHFQTDGYLSEHSAELYEHQVEMLFSGAADAMRRMIIPPLRKHFDTKDGKGLTFLEIGAGVGSATRFVRLAFPKAKIVALDLSDPYLHKARERLSRYSRIDYVQGDGADLPFESSHFDAVYSVFLFHELPLEARKAVLEESKRVLKPGGFIGLVDSIQAHDNAELKPVMTEFPHNFHEPFYRNYIENPMEGLLRDTTFVQVESDHAFFSKVCWGKKQS